jgi:hypothetical protein
MPSANSILNFFPKKQKPRDVQKYTLLELEKRWHTADIFVVNLPVASGKCHKLGQKVLMYDGTLRNIEDLEIGDKMMGPDSTPRTVSQLHQGTEQLYTIRPKRGQDWTVTGNHILRLWRYVREFKQGKRAGKFVHEEISVLDYINKSDDYKNNSWMQRVAVEFPNTAPLDVENDIPAYILGLWLGDGTSTHAAITSMDKEIYNKWIQYGHKKGCYLRIDHNGSKAFSFNLSTKPGQPNPIRSQLRELNLLQNKHIPHKYLTADKQTRRELLAGIIDTDGHVSREDRSIEITQSRKRLADDILFLARSLGYSASQSVKMVNGVEYYRCHISGQDIDKVPTALEYKRPVNSKSNQNNYKFDIIPAQSDKYAGVTVDKDNLYLLDDFTISHNSSCAISLAHWQKSASIITPTKLLVNQYKEEYKYLQVLRSKSDYYCDIMKSKLNVRPKLKGSKAKLCPKHLECDGCDQYRLDLKKSRVMPYLLSNYYIYLAHGLYRETLIIDEAHLLIPMLKRMAAKKLWKFEYKWPDYIRTRQQLKDWVNSLPPEAFNRRGKASGETSFGLLQERLIFLKDELNSYRPRFLISITKENHRGTDRDCIMMEPLDIKDAPPIMWPSQVKKIILMSATMNRKDIEQLGMTGKKVQYIEADSPITAERRPVILPTSAKSMAYKYQQENIKHLAEFISETGIHHEGEKGIVHTTYSLAKLLKEQTFPPEISDRLIFHTQKDKTSKYNEFRSAPSESGKILVACGMYEGIDLAYDSGRWQIISKVPWPSLADPAIKYLCKLDGEWYAWETIKTLLQGCGRICRTPTDFGATYIWDNTFVRLYNENPTLIPLWFKNSIIKET